jgi:ABC-type dipeptide/oligopeptide/nickel transport system permease component
MIPVLIVVSILVFAMLHLAPGDPVRMMVNPRLGEEAIQQKRVELGLDRPLHVQYVSFMKRIFTGNLGRSIYTREPIADMLLQRLPNTLELGFAALIIAFFVAIPAGTIAAKWRGQMLDYSAMFLAVIGLAMPQFWLGLVLMLIFAVKLGWFPVAGTGGLSHLVLPSITLAAYFAGLMARMTRSSLLEELGKDYIYTARSKGLREAVVLIKHGLRNALTPVISILGMEVGWLIGGAVVVEFVFNRPGLGRLMVHSLYMRDYPVVQFLILFLVVSVIIGNLAADLMYSLANPKIRYV